MDNMIFLLGLFLLSVANVKAQTLTQTDSLTMETMLHNLLKTEDIHPPKTGISVHFSGSLV